MFQDAFIRLGQQETESLLERVNPYLDGSPFDPAHTTLMAKDMPFYPGYRFLDIGDYSKVPTVRKFALVGEDSVTILNWTNEPIYALNESVPIALDEKSVQDYVRFFFTFVRGHYGRFVVTETVDDIQWKDEPPAQARRALGRMVEPVHLVSVGSDGTFHVSACMTFRDSLFRTKIDIKPDGLVTMAEEELLVEDMPVLDDIFGQ